MGGKRIEGMPGASATPAASLPGMSPENPEVPSTTWNERYAAQADPYGVGPNQFVAAELGGLSPRRVLDLGCGNGRNAVWLALEGHDVTGLDVSEVGISRANALAEQAGVAVDFRVCDVIEDYEPEPRYDLVLLSYLQLPQEMREVAHRKALDSLAPGGEIFLIAHHADNLEHGVGGPPMPDVLFDEAQVARDFASLEIVRNEKVFRDVDRDGAKGIAHDILFRGSRPT